MSDEKKPDGPPPADEATVFMPASDFARATGTPPPSEPEAPAEPVPPADPEAAPDPFGEAAAPPPPSFSDAASSWDQPAAPTEPSWGEPAAPAEPSWGEPAAPAEPPAYTPPPEDRPADALTMLPEEPAFVPPPPVAAPPPPPPPPPPPMPSAPPSYPEQTEAPRGSTYFAPRTDGQGIQVGDVLNHIFEVKRFIARGGMGEVFEGTNVNSEERVAIKVMLPALAADANVIAMFRKEARTLTRLQHEALVQYRVLAQEPQLGVLYIVTEYIDGTNLADVFSTLEVSPKQLAQLLKRLAAGLRAAHALGAVHRDISPDNVLLGEGMIENAKIIDFGIAKELDPSTATIVGDGFAGKLNYVAPEQLGDFGREVGPWTDIYSLALVILAVAGKKNVQMGGSLVDAVDKRRAGVDVSVAPEELQPVLSKMLVANPAERFRSMDEVLDALRAIDGPPPGSGDGEGAGGASKGLVFAGIAVVLLLAAVIGWLVLGREDPAQVAKGGAGAPAAKADPLQMARAAVDSALPSVGCSWLDITEIAPNGKTVAMKLTGVAGNPATAQNEISRALSARGINDAAIDFAEVAPITQAGCAVLDTYRQIREPSGDRLTIPQRSFQLRMMQEENSNYKGQLAARAPININAGEDGDFTLIGLEPSGILTTILPSRAATVEASKVPNTTVVDQGGGKFRIDLDVNHAGWSGLLLLVGKGPFGDFTAPGIGARGGDWQGKVMTEAASKGWQADMAWFKTTE